MQQSSPKSNQKHQQAQKEAKPNQGKGPIKSTPGNVSIQQTELVNLSQLI